MTRIRHDRPQHRLADNFKRELHKLGLHKVAACSPEENHQIPNACIEVLTTFLRSCSGVMESESALIASLIASKGKRASAKVSLEAALKVRDCAADAVISSAIPLDHLQLAALSQWIKRLEMDAVRGRKLAILDVLFEQGLKAAFKRERRSA